MTTSSIRLVGRRPDRPGDRGEDAPAWGAAASGALPILGAAAPHLARRLALGAPTPEHPGMGPAAIELLERADDLAPLTAAFDAAARGAGSVALVLGEAGIGKSALVARLAADVGVAHAPNGGAGGARVLWGACDALFTPRPLGP